MPLSVEQIDAPVVVLVRDVQVERHIAIITVEKKTEIFVFCVFEGTHLVGLYYVMELVEINNLEILGVRGFSLATALEVYT